MEKNGISDKTKAIHAMWENLKNDRLKAIADLESYKNSNIPQLTQHCNYIGASVPEGQCKKCKEHLRPKECPTVKASMLSERILMKGEIALGLL